MPRKKGTAWKIELAGMKFGKWFVLHRNVGSLWECRCECGTIRAVQGSSLKLGTTKSCGCTASDWCRTHGMEGTRIYNTWAGMIQRCTNPKARWYHRYGGRGITVCQLWRDSFQSFYDDMGEAPTGRSLDRIDNDGHYQKDNCRWATRTEQIRNRQTTRMLTLDGQTLSLPAWAEKIGMSRKMLERRIRDGWTTEKALTASKSGRWGIL